MTITSMIMESSTHTLFGPEHYHDGCQTTFNGIKHLLPIESQDRHVHQGNQITCNENTYTLVGPG